MKGALLDNACVSTFFAALAQALQSFLPINTITL